MGLVGLESNSWYESITLFAGKRVDALGIDHSLLFLVSQQGSLAMQPCGSIPLHSTLPLLPHTYQHVTSHSKP